MYSEVVSLVIFRALFAPSRGEKEPRASLGGGGGVNNAP